MAAKPEHPYGNDTAVTSTDAWQEIITTPDWPVHNLLVTLAENPILLRFGENAGSYSPVVLPGVAMDSLNLPAGTKIECKSMDAGNHATLVFASVWQDR